MVDEKVCCHSNSQVVSDGICVNVILPGITNTPRRVERMKTTAKLENKSVEEVEVQELQGIPMGRFIRYTDIILRNLIGIMI